PNLSRTPASVCPSDFDCLAPSLHPDTVHPSLSHSHLPQPLPRLPTHLLAITPAGHHTVAITNLFSLSPPSSPCFPQPATLIGTHGLIPYSTVSHIPPPIIRLQLPPPVPSQALIPFSHPASIRIRNGVFHPFSGALFAPASPTPHQLRPLMAPSPTPLSSATVLFTLPSSPSQPAHLSPSLFPSTTSAPASPTPTSAPPTLLPLRHCRTVHLCSSTLEAAEPADVEEKTSSVGGAGLGCWVPRLRADEQRGRKMCVGGV
ncbi:unnamed protein product, partial [Closterium sp. Naga37s-1]